MRIKVFCWVLLLLMLNVVMLYAQPGEPCGGNDDDGTCPSPLDTWVLVLAAVCPYGFRCRASYTENKKSPEISPPL